MRTEVFRNNEGGRPWPDPPPDRVKCWGAGGKGGSSSAGEGGGGGGAFAQISGIGVADPGTPMDIQPGSMTGIPGANGSSVQITNGAMLVRASNGHNGSERSGGLGGNVEYCIGELIYPGGKGGDSVGANAGGGGGGSSAGPSGAGNNGQSNSGETGGGGGAEMNPDSPGGRGGDKNQNGQSAPATTPLGNFGSGGGGGGKGAEISGFGAAGVVVYEWDN